MAKTFQFTDNGGPFAEVADAPDALVQNLAAFVNRIVDAVTNRARTNQADYSEYGVTITADQAARTVTVSQSGGYDQNGDSDLFNGQGPAQTVYRATRDGSKYTWTLDQDAQQSGQSDADILGVLEPEAPNLTPGRLALNALEAVEGDATFSFEFNDGTAVATDENGDTTTFTPVEYEELNFVPGEEPAAGPFWE